MAKIPIKKKAVKPVKTAKRPRKRIQHGGGGIRG